MDRLRVLAIEPYLALSHRIFLEGWARRTSHAVEIWSLPARKWKWRMRGAAWHFADLAAERAELPPDVVLVSDYLNLADWRALVPPRWRSVPCLLYFHENQIGYPLGEKAPVDRQFAWINVSSALAADRVLFNSRWHRSQLLGDVRRTLDRMPDPVPEGLCERLEARSGVLPVGVDFEEHDRRATDIAPWPPQSAPRLIWNHRWQQDKDPDRFAQALVELAGRGVEFRAIICGQAFREVPPSFRALPEQLGDRLEHLGFFASRGEYLDALTRSHVVVSTARHEFFGVSIVDAMRLGCVPVAPNDLSYPELVPPQLHSSCLYARSADLADHLERLLAAPPRGAAELARVAAGRYDWRELAPVLDAELSELLG